MNHGNVFLLMIIFFQDFMVYEVVFLIVKYEIVQHTMYFESQ